MASTHGLRHQADARSRKKRRRSKDATPQLERESETDNAPGPNPIQHLQTSAGNQTVQALYDRGELQAKLEVGRAGSPAEREAEAVAERVMRMDDPVMSSGKDETEQERSMCDDCTPSPASSIAGNPSTEVGTVPETTESVIHDVLKEDGTPLPSQTRSYFEPRFGADFSDVRVHDGPEADDAARSINAAAFTLGKNIIFKQGKYSPGDSAGKHLIAHELAHVNQQYETPRTLSPNVTANVTRGTETNNNGHKNIINRQLEPIEDEEYWERYALERDTHLDPSQFEIGSGPCGYQRGMEEWMELSYEGEITHSGVESRTIVQYQRTFINNATRNRGSTCGDSIDHTERIATIPLSGNISVSETRTSRVEDRGGGVRETTNEREWESLDEARVGNLHQLLAGIQSLKHRVEAPPASPVARRAEENPDDPGAWGWTIAVVGTTAAGAGITIMIISPEPVSTISGIATVAGAIASLGNFGRNVYMEVKESDPEKLTIEGEKRTDLHNPSRTLLTIFQEEMESIYSENLEEEIVWEELEREFNERRELEELEQTDPTREYPSSGHIPW